MVRKEAQSQRDALRKPGPPQTAPWLIAETGILAAPSDTLPSEIPRTLIDEAKSSGSRSKYVTVAF